MECVRNNRSWDVVLVGCGKAKRAEVSPAIDLYTGPVFAAHRARSRREQLLAEVSARELAWALELNDAAPAPVAPAAPQLGFDWYGGSTA